MTLRGVSVLAVLSSEIQGGDTVKIYILIPNFAARGPQAHLLTGVHEQSYIGVVMGYAACLADRFGCPPSVVAAAGFSRQDYAAVTARAAGGSGDVRRTWRNPSNNDYDGKSNKDSSTASSTKETTQNVNDETTTDDGFLDIYLPKARH
jgi:hypothetical protein